ncbi:hypothetical protein IE53DRAFT_161681 [Violaceomyces palustris]|uniref:Uncharacterized protein n=1 Tax=Violaceomyces palustris TaxID=1673888 RepID=A0ACD0NTH7_9BASI|nr:hypothetical protein IE53DRAFT_161681 [Violaceomyces palustris]
MLLPSPHRLGSLVFPLDVLSPDGFHFRSPPPTYSLPPSLLSTFESRHPPISLHLPAPEHAFLLRRDRRTACSLRVCLHVCARTPLALLHPHIYSGRLKGGRRGRKKKRIKDPPSPNYGIIRVVTGWMSYFLIHPIRWGKRRRSVAGRRHESVHLLPAEIPVGQRRSHDGQRDFSLRPNHL